MITRPAGNSRWGSGATWGLSRYQERTERLARSSLDGTSHVESEQAALGF